MNDDALNLDFDKNEARQNHSAGPDKENKECEATEETEKIEATEAAADKVEDEPQASSKSSKKNGIFAKKPKKREPVDSHTPFGAMLREGRERANMTIQEVEAQCKVRAQYIRSLENDDLNNLPPPVYICAYIKTLCELYKIPSVQIDSIIAEIRSKIEIKVNKKLLCPEVADDLENADSPKSTRNILISIAALAVLLLISVCVMLFFPRSEVTSDTPENPGDRFNPLQIEKLIAPEQPDAVNQKIPVK